MAALESNETAVGDQRSQQALVERVLASQQFRRTVRLRDFLRYVASRGATHPGAPIPEHDIGTAVFGRPADYDTGADNIVRVSAGDLRRRLEHYFLDEGLHEPLVCEMPRGGYALLFRLRAVPVTAANAADAAAAPVVAADPAPEILTPAEPPVTPPPPPAIAGTPSWRSWLQDIRTLVLLAACLCVTGLGALLLLRSRQEPWQRSAALQALWSEFLSPDTDTDVVLADTGLALVKSITGAGVDLPEYLGYGYKELKTDGRFDSSTRTALGYILERNTGSIGDFQAARSIFALTNHPARLMLGSAHDFTPEAVKGRNVVLLGSSASNPWVDLYREQRSFLMQKETPGSVVTIHNLDVKPGEQAVYQVDTSKDSANGLAVIALLPNFETEKRVLILEGSDSQATLAASNFITSPAGALAVQQRLGHAAQPGHTLPAHVEILLRSSKLLATPLQASIVAVHTRED